MTFEGGQSVLHLKLEKYNQQTMAEMGQSDSNLLDPGNFRSAAATAAATSSVNTSLFENGTHRSTKCKNCAHRTKVIIVHDRSYLMGLQLFHCCI